MIRVDSMEQYKKLRESGFTDDIMVLMKGGEDNEGNAGETGETGETEGTEGTEETEETGEKTSLQFDYDKVVEELEKRLTPVIQKVNRESGSGVKTEDDDIDAIMKKFTEM